MTGIAGAGIIPGWQCSPAARPVRWTAIAQALVRDRIPLEAGTLPGARVACVQLFPGEEQSATKESTLSLTFRLKGSSSEGRSQNVMLILSGVSFLL